MSYLTDKYGSNSAAKAATTSPSKTYGAGTGVVNSYSGNTGGGGNKDDGNKGNKDNSGKPSPMISSNSPSNNTSPNVSLTSPGSSDYNGGSQTEWETNFGEDDSESYLDSVLAEYRAAQAAQKAAIQAAVDQSVNSLNAQKTTTTQDYADAYRQLYLNNMKSQKNIGQQMAAQGVTGGASESTLLGLNTNYEDNLRQGKVAEQNALNELEQAIINAQLSGSIEAANTNATTAQNNANAYLTAWQNALTEQQMEASANSENRQYNYQMAMAMLQAGSMPSDQLLLNAGISKADAQTIVAQVAASKIASGSNNSSNTKKQTTDTGVMKYGEWGDNEVAYTADQNVKNYVANGDKSGAIAVLYGLYKDQTIDSKVLNRLIQKYGLKNS